MIKNAGQPIGVKLPCFDMKLIDDVVVVVDLDVAGHPSVTNGAQEIVYIANKYFCLLGKRLIYRDSEKHYDEIKFDHRCHFVGFQTLVSGRFVVDLYDALCVIGEG